MFSLCCIFTYKTAQRVSWQSSNSTTACNIKPLFGMSAVWDLSFCRRTFAIAAFTCDNWAVMLSMRASHSNFGSWKRHASLFLFFGGTPLIVPETLPKTLLSKDIGIKVYLQNHASQPRHAEQPCVYVSSIHTAAPAAAANLAREASAAAAAVPATAAEACKARIS